MFYSSSQSIWSIASFSSFLFFLELVMRCNSLLKWTHLGFYDIFSWFLHISKQEFPFPVLPLSGCKCCCSPCPISRTTLYQLILPMWCYLNQSLHLPPITHTHTHRASLMTLFIKTSCTPTPNIQFCRSFYQDVSQKTSTQYIQKLKYCSSPNLNLSSRIPSRYTLS